MTKRYRALVLFTLLLTIVGCKTRSFYREQADAQAHCLIDQKSVDAGASLAEYRVGVNPQSRMFDQTSADCPPMPPDDPTSHQLLECVDGKKGAASNRCADRTPYIENPEWQKFLPRDAQGRVQLDLPGALDLARLHSPFYQSQIEELYLSALDVSFERFRFDAQFFGGSSIFFTADGRDRNGTGDSSSLLNVSPSRPGNRYRVERLTATGGQIVAGFANSLVWQFAGPNDYSSSTLLDFTILQPLLRTGGRTFVLERLTIAERALLANVRTMERFQRGFYLNIATGIDAGQGPSRRGGFFGGSGLEGFSGVGGGGFGRVGGFNGGGGGGGGFTGGAGAGQAGGYLGLLQVAQQLRNQRANVAALGDSVEQLVASYEAGRIDRFQVGLARQALFNAQSQLLTAGAAYEATLDEYKITLGLPPNLDLQLTDPVLDTFNLRSLELTDLQLATADVASQLRADTQDEKAAKQQRRDQDKPAILGSALGTKKLAELPNPKDKSADDSPTKDDIDQPELLPTPKPSERAQQARQLAEQASEQLEIVRQDFAHLKEVLPKRISTLKLLADRDEVALAEIDPTLLAPERLEKRVTVLGEEIDRTEKRLEKIATKISQLEASAKPSSEALRRHVSDLSSLLLELSLLQARARLDGIVIEPTDLTAAEAVMIACRNRRDWRNARASLVDSWRLVNFNANALQSDLDIVFSGDIGNLGDNPFRIRDTTGRLRVGLEFDAPLTRLSERNLYRQSQIEYQQARRSYYRFVDRVSQDLRNTLRQIRLNEINLELRREAVLVAIASVDITQLRLSEPPKPGVDGELANQLSNTTARDLVQALGDLLNVQNDFLSVWVNNRVQRMELEWDLGIMQIDPTGQRIPIEVPLRVFVDTTPLGEMGQPLPAGGDVGSECCELDRSSPRPLPQPEAPLPEELQPATLEAVIEKTKLEFPAEITRDKFPLKVSPKRRPAPPKASRLVQPVGYETTVPPTSEPKPAKNLRRLPITSP